MMDVLSTDKSGGLPGSMAGLCFLTVLPSVVSIGSTTTGGATTVGGQWNETSVDVATVGVKITVVLTVMDLFNIFVLRALLVGRGLCGH